MVSKETENLEYPVRKGERKTSSVPKKENLNPEIQEGAGGILLKADPWIVSKITNSNQQNEEQHYADFTSLYRTRNVWV